MGRAKELGGAQGVRESKGVRESEVIRGSKGVLIHSIRGWGVSTNAFNNILALTPRPLTLGMANAGHGYAFTAHYAFALPNAFTAPNASAPHNAFGPNVITTLSVMLRVSRIIVHVLMAFFFLLFIAMLLITPLPHNGKISIFGDSSHLL